MPQARLFFFGLISHVGGGAQRDHAVVVRDEEHDGRIVWAADAGWDIPKQDVKLTRISFRVDGRPQDRPALVDPGGVFARTVPHLQMLTGKPIKPTVAGKTNAAAATAYLDYPGGTLQVYDMYRCHGRYNGGDPQCVARVTVLACEFARTFGLFIDDEDEPLVELTTDGDLLIQNVDDQSDTPSPQCNDTHYDPHLRRQYKLLEEADMALIIQESGACGESGDAPTASVWLAAYLRQFARDNRRTSVHLECSNSQYP